MGGPPRGPIIRSPLDAAVFARPYGRIVLNPGQEPVRSAPPATPVPAVEAPAAEPPVATPTRIEPTRPATETLVAAIPQPRPSQPPVQAPTAVPERTLPPPNPNDVQRLRRTAQALRIDWPAAMSYPDFIRSLDQKQPSHAAMVVSCTRLLRGSGYVSFVGELPDQSEHTALASQYAHVTAPLRRLGDRYASEICIALCAGEEVPEWVLDRLGEVPDTMQKADRLAHQYENAVIDLVEAGVLRARVGEKFDGVIVDRDEKDDKRGTVSIQEPAIEANVSGPEKLPLGTEVTVTLAEADLGSRSVAFSLEG
jgi:exoribonuclease R